MRNQIPSFFFLMIVLPLVSVCPAQEAAATEPFDAFVRVTDTVVNTVRPLIFGDNIEWTNSGMGIYLHEENRFDRAVVEEMRKAGITHLRYPGGTLSDYFDWHKAVGEDRQPIPNPFSAPKKDVPEYPHFGPAEFMALCRDLDIPGTITLNAGTGAPEDAARWVKYFKEHDFPVTAYAVGNEIYMMGRGDEEDVPEHPAGKTPEEYIAFYLACHDAVTAVAPDVKLGAIGLYDTGVFPLGKYPDWMEKVLSQLGDKMDFLDVHNGYAPVLRTVGFNADLRRSDDEYAATFLAASEYVRMNIEATKANIAEFAPDGGKDIAIHITEYGPLLYPFIGTDEQKAGDMAWNRSLAGALYQACLFNVFLKEPRLTSANHLPLYQAGFGALIGVDWAQPRRIWRNAVYYVFKMYSRMAGRDVLAVNVESPNYNAKSNGIVHELEDVPYVDAGAYRSKDKQRLTLFLINRDLARPASVAIDPGWSVFSVETVATLAADSYLAVNGPDDPAQIVPVTRPVGPPAKEGPFTLLLPKHSLTAVECSAETLKPGKDAP